MAARRGPATRGKSEPQGQLAATTTSFGCSAGLSSMDVTKPQLFGVMSFISEMNAQPWLSAGFASQAATSSVTSADKKAPLKGSVVNDGSAAYCERLFHTKKRAAESDRSAALKEGKFETGQCVP